MSQFRHDIEPGRPRATAKGWLAAVCAALAILSAAPRDLPAIDLSDTPMLARIKPPPPNIMFLLDDSGSMRFEVLVMGGYDGSYPNPNKPDSVPPNATNQGFCFLFDDGSTSDWYAGPEGRKYWRTQLYQTNAMYYNPSVRYGPWPSYGSLTFTNANPDTPRIHPFNGSDTLNLGDTSYTVGGVDVPHSRYVVYSASQNKHYLVVLDRASSSKKYYTFTVTGTGLAEKFLALTLESNPPADVIGDSYSIERQNFANWFTYHRRREFVAKNAIASIITRLKDVRVGIYGINNTIVEPLQSVNVTGIQDKAEALLRALYPYVSDATTPLKKGLDTIGKYFQTNDGRLGTKQGVIPYGLAQDGGACQQSFTIIITDGFYSDPGYGSPKTLADIASDYYNNDLHSHLNQVPTNRYDTASHQHMVTYAVAFGAAGTLNPADYNHDRENRVVTHKVTGHPVQWPAVGDIKLRSPQTVDDLWHAAVNGSGQFHSAGNPTELADALNEIMKGIAEIQVASSASVTVNGDYLYGKLGDNTFIYQALYSYQRYEWTGDVKAYPLDATTGDVLTRDPRVWSAAGKLAAKASNDRLIATFNGTNGIKGIPFRFDSLTDPQKTALDSDPVKAADKVMYLRGEGITGYRTRSQKLGDIVNSAPVFLDGVIYAGGNDGMLHAFNAANGEELFAYVPKLVFGNLKLLTDPAYTHSFYVDLTPSVKKGKGIFAAGTTSTLLVGGLGKGGKGYFALDITGADNAITTEAILASRVRWEFPQTSDPDMGYSFSKPVIVKSNSTAHPWVVIFGNGYNSASGKSVLYIIDARTGEEITRIYAGQGPDNGLSTPIAVDPDFNGTADFVYAGDIKGNLWKFNLKETTSSNWKVAFSKDNAVQPLFQAKGPGGTVQPITTRPDVMNHPEKHGFIVCFGTGNYLGDSDYSDGSVQSVYGIWDYGDPVYDPRRRNVAAGWSSDDPTEFLGAFDRDNSRKLSNQPDKVSLLQQTQEVHTVTAGTFRILSNDHPIWLTQEDTTSGQKPNPSAAAVNHAGYYFDLGDRERVISDVILRNKLLLVVGFTPPQDRCNIISKSIFMEINAFTGGSTGSSLFDITGDLRVDANDIVRVNFRGTDQNLAPSGKEYVGNIQPPAIMRLPGSEAYEKKYLSSSTGNIELLHEIGIKLGMAYWMEVHY